MTSYLGGGQISLDRWEGLKEWHRRHQDLLGEQGCSIQSLPSVVDIPAVKRDSSHKNVSKFPERSEAIDLFSEPLAKHDLSIIPEADEDSRSRDGDFDTIRSKQGRIVPQKTDSRSKTEENSTLPANLNRGNNGPSVRLHSNMQQNQNPSTQDSKVVKRPFLRRGQGLVKYNLKPEDLKRPYRKGQTGAVPQKEKSPKPPSRFAAKRLATYRATVQSTQRNNWIPNKQPKSTDLEIPMQRLVLSVPPRKSNSVEIGSWSQVFGSDTKSSTVVAAEKAWSHSSHEQLFSKPEVSSGAFQDGERLSPSRKKITSSKTASSPEEDLDSLAAYLDLEQHVGNASFCSTSSKVDRLVTKSSKPIINQSNPDAITQSKQLTPVKTGRKLITQGRGSNSTSADHLGMWSATDIENLIKARARRSGSLIKTYTESHKRDAKNSCAEIPGSGIGKTISDADHPGPRKSADAQLRTLQNENGPASQEPHDIDLMLDVWGPARKPHLMKTMSGIDLDSSLIKNALAPSASQQESEWESESETPSSDSSSEEDLEDDLEVLPTDKKSDFHPPIPLKLVSDTSLEEINHQIESHLSDLRKEIETLQAAKGKTQKYVSSLEKKVQELEHRVILDARAFNKRLEDEREAAIKRLAEEQAKFVKEKQNLKRTLQEERRKATNPVTQQEFLRLKQEVAQWEEKWRSDRAKARGLESNLRIQLSNLKRENEKLKEENNKFRREMETALNAAKAKASSNTRIINSIAQQLGKPKVTIVREENPKLNKKQMLSSAYNLKTAVQVKDSKPVTTIDNFPKLPYTSNNEWSTDEEIDLGKETSDEDDINDNVEVEIMNSNCQPQISSTNIFSANGNTSQKLCTLEQESINVQDIQQAQAKYDAIFGKSGMDSVITPDINGVFYINNIGLQDPILPPGTLSSAPNSDKNEKFVKSIHHPDGKVEQVEENGTKVITYPDGTWRRHSSSGSVMTVPPSGWPVQISYFNGDQLEKLSDGTTRYFYAKTNIWQTTYPEGHEELQYPSGQVERREADGSVRVLLPGSSSSKSNVKVANSKDDSSADGISVEKLPNGDTVILLPNGECELHTKDYMKKDFMDGTVKFLYKDGTQETRYPSGRIRIKDAQGNLVKDTGFT